MGDDRPQDVSGGHLGRVARAGRPRPGGRFDPRPAIVRRHRWIGTAAPDPFGFAAFARERWPDVRLSRPHPDYGVDYTALLPASQRRRGRGRSAPAPGRPDHGRPGRHHREEPAQVGGVRPRQRPRPARRRLPVAEGHGSSRWTAGRHGDAPPTMTAMPLTIPDAYELDDLTFALLWACASLDTGLQVDDQELTVAVGELAPYESLPSSAVSREAAAGLGTTSQMWLGSDFCARHILRNQRRCPPPRPSGHASRPAARPARGCSSITSTPTFARPATASGTARSRGCSAFRSARSPVRRSTSAFCFSWRSL